MHVQVAVCSIWLLSTARRFRLSKLLFLFFVFGSDDRHHPASLSSPDASRRVFPSHPDTPSSILVVWGAPHPFASHWRFHRLSFSIPLPPPAPSSQASAASEAAAASLPEGTKTAVAAAHAAAAAGGASGGDDGGGGEGEGVGGGLDAGAAAAGAAEDDCPDLDSYVEDNLMQGDEVCGAAKEQEREREREGVRVGRAR